MTQRVKTKGTSKHSVALTIAGFDPSSGAGVTADLKVFAAHGIYGVAAITALTVQSTQGVRRVEPQAPELLEETLACLAEDVEISGVKIGMLANAQLVGATARFLAASGIPRERIVLDTIVRSSSGRELLDYQGMDRLRNELIPLVGWITPNTHELAALNSVHEPELTHESIPDVAAKMSIRYPDLNMVVTGGHLDRPDDYLRTSNGSEHWFVGERIETTATHGTGCTFSSALLSQLLIGNAPREAVAGAKQYVRSAMEAAYPIGKGHGPLNHLYRLDHLLPFAR